MQDAIFSLRCCNMTDRGLEALMEFLQSLYSLEINGCNEITEQGLWSSLAPRLISLTVQVNRLRGQTGCPKKSLSNYIYPAFSFISAYKK